jgi:hypothetical protein
MEDPHRCPPTRDPLHVTTYRRTQQGTPSTGPYTGDKLHKAYYGGPKQAIPFRGQPTEVFPQVNPTGDPLQGTRSLRKGSPKSAPTTGTPYSGPDRGEHYRGTIQGTTYMGPHTCYLPQGTNSGPSTLAQVMERHRCDRHSSFHESNPIRRSTCKVRPKLEPLKGTAYSRPDTGDPYRGTIHETSHILPTTGDQTVDHPHWSEWWRHTEVTATVVSMKVTP